MDGAIVLVTQGSCSFVEKAINVQAAGAVGIIVMNHVEAQTAFAMGYDRHNDAVKIIAVMVSKEVGLQLLDTVGQLELHSQQTYIDMEAQAEPHATDSAGSARQEQHVVVPDATRRWLQSHEVLHRSATPDGTPGSLTWQSMLTDLAASVFASEGQTLQQTNTLMPDTSQQCVRPN